MKEENVISKSSNEQSQNENSTETLKHRQHLRRLELQAYSAVISAFRAQGDFNSDKKRLLNELRYFFSIPIERHQAEIRRAVNDDNLTKIAHTVTGEETKIEWMSEGRRLVPLVPRLIPKTSSTDLATKLATAYKKKGLRFKRVASCNEKIKKNALLCLKADSNLIDGPLKSIKRLRFEDDQSSETGSLSSVIEPRNILTIPGPPGVHPINNSTVSAPHIIKSYKIATKFVPTGKQSEVHQIAAFSAAPTQLVIPSSGTQLAISSASGPKILKGKGTPMTPQLLLLPSSGSSSIAAQQKTITIPISQSVKTLHLPVGASPTILYQTSPNPSAVSSSSSSSTITSSSGITIKTFKPAIGQTGKLPTNYIIVPSSGQMTNAAQPRANQRMITISGESQSKSESASTSKEPKVFSTLKEP